MEFLRALNAEQYEAVTSTEGFVRVIAGAGSGKTRALSHRFAFLVEEIGILPANILCVTFTNKSACEMRQRIHALTGDNDTGFVCTFHSFCVSVLQEDSSAVQYPKSFLVLDNADIDDILKIIYDERGLNMRDMTFAKAREMIEILKTCERPDYYNDLITLSIDTLKKKYEEADAIKDIIFYGYLYQQKKCFALDYNDLIKFTLYIFKHSEEIRLKWQRRLEYIMIDEFQDIDALQYNLMKVLCAYHKNLFIVGDPDQTIYTWRGANVKFLLDFDKEFPNVKTVVMNKNYRSSPQILRVANSLIDANEIRIKKALEAIRPDGRSVLCHHAPTSEKEAVWIADNIIKLRAQGIACRDIAILYRAHFLTRVIEEVFVKAKIPYTIYSGVQFFNRAEIKDALAYLRMLVCKDDLSFMRIVNRPKRSIGLRRINFLKEYADEHRCSLYQALCDSAETSLFASTGAQDFISLIETFSADCQNKPISEILSSILDKSGYEVMLRTEGSQERLDNLAELKQAVFDFETTSGEEASLDLYLSHVALFSSRDAEGTGDKVKLMTVHTAKGLEFPYVFLCAMNEGIFPSKKTSTQERMEEERRLAFVALTRAQDGLFLSDAEGENLDGSFRHPSRFIWDIDASLLEFCPPPSESMIAEAKNYIARTRHKLVCAQELFAVGDKISHAVCGNGIILSIDKDKSAYIVQFENMNTPRAIAFRAKLKRRT